ncbi:MAG: DUF5320 domain-containing protein [Terracidiphilus sp.]
MPFGDQTGPLGQGPMTGRGQGYCTGNTRPGRFSASSGFGMGRGGRGGRGWQNRFRGAAFSAGETPAVAVAAPVGRQQEVDALKAAISGIASTLSEIQRRLEALEASPKAE